MNKKKKYIFFIRDYNDWDNIAPIIFYLAKTSEEKIFICFYKKDLRFSDQFKYLNKVVGHKLHVLYWSATKFSVFFNLTIKILNKIFKILNLEKKISYNTRVSNDELKNG